MRLEMINENKLKIIFDSKELEESNISVHSFLANSPEAQKLFLAILDIAYEDFGFDFINSKISYETYSFDNKTFVIFVSKTDSASGSVELSNFSQNLLCNSGIFSRDYNNCASSGFKFEGNSLLEKNINDKEIITNHAIYIFNSFENIFDFCSYLKSIEINKTTKSSLYQYKNNYFLVLTPIENKQNEFFKSLNLISEIKTELSLSNINLLRLKEFSSLLIKDNAIDLL